MKKLIMMIAVVATAVVANAATVSWQAQKGYLYEAGTSTKITSGDVYLMFVTSTYTQDSLVSAFSGANGDVAATLAAMGASGAMATGASAIGSNARIPMSDSTYAMTGDMSAYFVVFNGGNMFVSGAVNATYDALTDKSTISFDAMSTPSKAAAMDASAGYTGAGWYAVPEPTSGLLMLVGLAGLALRRRRA